MEVMKNFIWHVYNVRGVDQTSGKKAKLKIIARNEAAAEKEAVKRGLMSPYTFAEIDFEEPTDRQISYAEDLGVKIMAGMNRKDISALIDKHNDNDTTPTDGLMTFAYEHDIYFSPYIGEHALCTLLFNELPVEDKTAFFCYAVHQSLTGERLGNLDTSPARDLIYQFADIYSLDDSYQRSLDEYSGGDLVVFGESQGGGSKRKKAYQDAKTYLDALLPVEDDFITDPETGEVIAPKVIPPDAEIPDDGFIVIGGQVAMPEETVAALLGVTIDRLHELSRSVDMDNREGGIYVRGGKQYFASPKVIFKVRDANGKKSADLSNQKLFTVFDKAEARLTLEEHKKKTRRFWFKAGAVVLAIFAYSHFSEPSKPSRNPPPTKVEQPVSTPDAEKKPAPTPAPAPAKILDLGMTLPQFQAAFAAKATQFGLDGVDLYSLTTEEGEAQDVFHVNDVSGIFSIQGTLNKQSGLIKEVWILIQPHTSDDMVAGIIVYGLFSHVFNPELDQNARGKLMDDLHLSKNVEYLQKHTATAVRGNAKYSARLMQGGIYMLAVSAKDL